jgi:hypothetical protein
VNMYLLNRTTCSRNLFRSTNKFHHIQRSAHSLPYIVWQNDDRTLRMATAMFAETLGNSQYSTRITLKSLSFTLGRMLVWSVL